MRAKTAVVTVGALAGAMTLAGVASAAPAQHLVVDSTADRPDATPGDGICAATGGGCTLRAAVMEADADPGSTIVIPAGHYTLTIPPRLGKAFEDYTIGDASNGNLKLMQPTTIVGAGADRTVIDGGRLDRVLTTLRPVTITDLTITGGDAAPTATPYPYYGGGGVLNTSNLVMSRVHITGNSATFGGGVFNIPFSDFKLSDSLVDGNTAGEAGGIRFDWTGTVERSVITGNRVVNPHDPTRPGELAGLGGGIDVRGLGIDVDDSQVTGNSAEDGGGGINITLAYFPDPGQPLNGLLAGFGGQVRLKNTVVGGNTGDCRAVIAKFVSQGGNTDGDRSCALTQPTDHPGGYRPSVS